MSDTRYDHCAVAAQKKNVFTRILEPVTRANRHDGTLQAEVTVFDVFDAPPLFLGLGRFRLSVCPSVWTRFFF